MSESPLPTIHDAARQCDNLFGKILRSISCGSPQLLLAEELRGRFGLWTAYVGVYAAIKASLDARLNGHQQIKDTVLELIDMIQRSLQWELIVNSSGSDEDKGFADINAIEESDHDAIDDLGLSAAESAIDRLLILAVAIRRSARRGHKQRNAIGGLEAHSESLCWQLVQSRYPNARSSLCHQIGTSIHVRGTSLMYLKKHNEKLALDRQRQGALPAAINERNAHEHDDASSKDHPNPIESKDKPLVSEPETLPSIFTPSAISRLTKVKDKPSGSIVSQGWTVQNGNVDYFSYPRKPEKHYRLKYCLCTLCGDPLEESDTTTTVWEAHVNQDLEPYICISEECREPPQYFARRKYWLEHMQTRHSMTWSEKVHAEMWYCNIGHNKFIEFDEKQSFVSHLNQEHGDQLTKSQLEGRARRNRRIATREAYVCPLCGCVPDGRKPLTREGLWHHIAAHLKSLAFLSLSYVVDENRDRESVTESSRTVLLSDDGHSDTSIGNRALDSLDDIPTTIVQEDGSIVVDGQIFHEPPLLDLPFTWPIMPSQNKPLTDEDLKKHRLLTESFLGQQRSSSEEPNLDQYLSESTSASPDSTTKSRRSEEDVVHSQRNEDASDGKVGTSGDPSGSTHGDTGGSTYRAAHRTIYGGVYESSSKTMVWKCCNCSEGWFSAAIDVTCPSCHTYRCNSCQYASGK